MSGLRSWPGFPQPEYEAVKDGPVGTGSDSLFDSAPLLMLTEAFLRAAGCPEQRTVVRLTDTEGLGFQGNARHSSDQGLGHGTEL